MAHVLIGWEFGGNRGHATLMLELGRALRARGHRVTLALQQIDAVTPEQAGDIELWQAPVSPRLFINSARRAGPAAATLGDTLARVGLDDPGLVAAMVLAWRRLFSALKPDMVIADYAPLLLLAARGALPSIAFGTGFSLPPVALNAFPSLTGKPAACDEAATLEAVNRGLAGLGDEPIAALPNVFEASAALVATFAELDPYRASRATPLVRPPVPANLPDRGEDKGDEVFVYGSVDIPADAALWAGLAASRLPVRVFVPGVPEAYREGLRARGLAVESAAQPFGLIAKRSRLLVSHGGHGFVCAGMVAGLPQVVCPYDLEKALTGAAVTRLGVGGVSPLRGIRSGPFAEALNRIYDSAELTGRARAHAEALRARPQPPLEASLIETIERLA